MAAFDGRPMNRVLMSPRGRSWVTLNAVPLLGFAAAGTYNISVQYKATSGSITAKERKLWVAVLGV